MDVDITRSIIVPVCPRRVVALLCRFGHRPFGGIDLEPSIILSFIVQPNNMFKLGSNILEIDERALGLA